MSGKGGHRSTTWSSNWKSGKTKLIRVPEVLENEIIAYARQLDNGDCVLQGNIKQLLDEFIEKKRQEYGKFARQRSEFSTSTRSWDMFNQFYEWVKSYQQSA